MNTTDPASPLEQLYLTVPCPVCRAPVGRPCTYRGGGHRLTHLRRQDKAVRADNRRRYG